MKLLGIVAGVAFFIGSMAATAQANLPCGQALDFPLQPGASLTVASLPAAIEVVGGEQNDLHISCTADDTEQLRHIHFAFSGDAHRAKVTISGDRTKHSNLKIHMQVPRKTNVALEMSAGEVKLSDVVGDKNINLAAGQVTIASAHGWDYKTVDASVVIGEVNAAAYGANKGGFFRKYEHKDPNGRYRLHAHVTTGQIDLLGNDANTKSE